MSKIKWGIGGIVFLGAVAVGGNIYADKVLQAFYEQKPDVSADANIKMQYSDFQMGLMTGSASWTMTFIPDPCIPAEFVILKGKDQIRRTLTGYAVNSDSKVHQGKPEAIKYLKGGVKADTTINWLGQSRTHFKLPAITENVNGMSVRMDALDAEIRTQSYPGQDTRLSAVKLSIPVINMTEKDAHLLAQDIVLETSQGLNKGTLKDGYTILSISSMSRNEGAGKSAGSIKNMHLESTTKVHEQTVDIATQFNIGKMTMPAAGSFDEFSMNMNLKDLKLKKVQSFFDTLENFNQTCTSSDAETQVLLDSLLAVIGDGFNFESKDNMIKASGGEAKASLTGKLMPGHHGSIAGFVQMVPSLLDFSADIQFDKALLKAMMNNYLQNAGRSMSDQEVENMIQAMQQQGQVQREGNNMIMRLDYKYGQQSYRKE
ncbi:DUF945 family protein [Acinetobacter chinensis]|uniref:DUF945 family protein n=1 Tax=Acinetobacter chinensis TaxID=2004650 RepID=A0ABU3WEH6_9GAMM|nr:DUF945 family protein [Acinetobacter chinensis]MDV2468819.1 DUF945 family protein [Acinetobacter chinensis]